MTALLVVTLALTAQSPPWCDGTRGALAGIAAQRAHDGAPSGPAVADAEAQASPDAAGPTERARADDVERVLATLPPVLAERARGDIGRTGRLEAAVEFTAGAVEASCATPTPVIARDELARILADPRFGGLRTDENVLDRLLERLGRWLEELLESDGMQVFAANTRTIYLGGLIAAVAWVGARLVRNARRDHARRAHAEPGGQRVERARVRAFVQWRADAVLALQRDPRAAMLLLRRALLARVGEVEASATRPSLTSREVLARLPMGIAEAVAPALACFDERFYAGGVGVADADALLHAVDRAAGGLATRSSASSASSASSTAAAVAGAAAAAAASSEAR